LTAARSPVFCALLETPGFVHPTSGNGLRIGEQQVNKNELVAAVAEEAGITKADAGNAIDAVFNAIEGALKKGDDVRIVGFGTFAVASRAATTGRNPRTGETIQIKASKQPKFKAGKGLKDALN
jgi:DNA-binding protein HU-beta